MTKFQWLQLGNWKLRNKLLLGFGGVLTLVAALGTVSIISNHSIQEKIRLVEENSALTTRYVNPLKFVVSDIQQLGQDIAATSDVSHFENIKTDVDSFRVMIAELPIRCNACHDQVYQDRMSERPDAAAMMESIKEEFETYHPSVVNMANSFLQKNKEEGSKLNLETADMASSIITQLDQIGEMSRAHLERSEKEVNELASRTTSMAYIFTGVALVVGFVGAFALGRKITSPLLELRDAAVQLATGDLSVRVEAKSGDEIGQLADAMNTMVENFGTTLSDVSAASSTVASASSEISSSTEEMAAGSHEQTSQAGEVASAVEEMAKTIIENSRNAKEAADVACEAKQAAEQGGAVVRNTISAMKGIEQVVKSSATTIQELGKSSEQIGEIIGVINDIADQTNLLALNAAIEAARAGEQGRGFAVVADEVRKLAERTTKATKQIADMIKRIQLETNGAVHSMQAGTKKVDDGIHLADEAGKSLEGIVTISQRVTEMVTQIAEASEQQSSASEQISKNVEAISAVTNESAMGTQQIARAAEDLNRLTNNLQLLVGKFKLSAERNDAAPAPTATRKRNSRAPYPLPVSESDVNERGELAVHS